MGGTPRTFVVTPLLVIDGVDRQDLSTALQSVVIHARTDRADALIEVASRVREMFPRGFDVGTSEVAVRISGQDEFSGTMDELELRAPEGGPTSLVLVATGTARAATARRVVRLQYGKGLESLSVRRRADRTQARGVLSSPAVHRGTRLRIDTSDPGMDGVFTVVELWHTFDAARGARIELVAEA